MKWIVQLDYDEFGEFEPNSIYFRRVCSDDIEYSFAYDTKKEALGAFCLGQVAMREMLKEREAEQKEAEGNKEWKHFAEATDEQKKKADELKEQMSKILRNDLRGENSHWEAHKSPIEKQFEKIDERLEVLEKKVEEIEKDLYKVSHLLGKDDSTDELKISKLDVASQKIDLLLTFLEAVCRNLGSDIKKMNNKPQTGKKNIEEINEVLEMVDKGKADTFYEQVNKIGKNGYKECKANPFRCEKCGLEFKVVSQERALVEHCPFCGEEPKRIKD